MFLIVFKKSKELDIIFLSWSQSQSQSQCFMQCLSCSFGQNQKINISDIIMTVTMTMTVTEKQCPLLKQLPSWSFFQDLQRSPISVALNLIFLIEFLSIHSIFSILKVCLSLIVKPICCVVIFQRQKFFGALLQRGCTLLCFSRTISPFCPVPYRLYYSIYLGSKTLAREN